MLIEGLCMKPLETNEFTWFYKITELVIGFRHKIKKKILLFFLIHNIEILKKIFFFFSHK